MRISDWSSDVCSSDLTVSAITRETAMAMYITPENIASIVSARASGESGTMSLRPTPDSVLKLRNSSSIHVRGCGGTDTSLKLPGTQAWQARSEEHTSELQSLMRNSYAVFCLTKKKNKQTKQQNGR